MGAISELSTAGGMLRRNPSIFVATLLVALLGSLSAIAQVVEAVNAVMAVIVSLVVVLISPFFVGGILGMAEEGLTGSTRLRTLFAEGTSNYLSLLGATILVGVLAAIAYIAYIIVALIIGVILGAGLSMAGGAGGGLLGLGFGLLFVVLGVVGLVLFLLFYLFLYFFDVAIVADERRAWDGIKRSMGFVRDHFISALGFTIITGILGIIAALPTFWLFFVAGDFSSQAVGSSMLSSGVPISRVWLPVLVSLILTTLFNAFTYAYKIAFYVDLTREHPTERMEPAD